MAELQWAVVGEEYGYKQRKGWAAREQRSKSTNKRTQDLFPVPRLCICMKQEILLALQK